jgi:flavorubredoxin
VIERVRKTLVDYQAGPLANYMPYTKHTDGILQKLAELKPRTIAPMHGSAYAGDGERAVRDLAVVMREVLG